MEKLIKILVGPSRHFHELKSGPIKYQKTKPLNPIWHVLVIDEVRDQMYGRIFPGPPSPDEIETVILTVLSSYCLPPIRICVPDVVEKLCPGILGKSAGILSI